MNQLRKEAGSDTLRRSVSDKDPTNNMIRSWIRSRGDPFHICKLFIDNLVNHTNTQLLVYLITYSYSHYYLKV